MGPRTKGSNLIPTVKTLRAHRERASELLPPALHSYLEGRLLPSEWYPEEDFMALMRAAVTLFGGGGEDAWRALGAAGAKAHVEGAYAVLVRPGPQALLESFPSFWTLVHDTGSWRVDVEPGAARLTLDDYAIGLPEFGPLMVGYFEAVLGLAGARQATAKVTACDERSVTWALVWSA